jgi:dolichyl-phosphate-mannose--protein O-mannosyl transferase
MPPLTTPTRSFAALNPVTGQDAYALWIVGIVIAAFTIVQLARLGVPRLPVPRLNGAHLATALAWAIIAISVAWALLHSR